MQALYTKIYNPAGWELIEWLCVAVGVALRLVWSVCVAQLLQMQYPSK